MASLLKKSYFLGEYRLETDKQLLSREGKSVHLPKRPFDVLVYLIEHRDEVVSRDELLDRFWDGRDVYDDALRKCVGRVRKALGDYADRPRFIETRYAGGYRFIGPLEELSVQSESAVVEIERTRGIKVVVEEEEIHDTEPAPEQAQVIQTPVATLSLSAPKSSHRMRALALSLIAIALAIGALIAYRSRATQIINAQASQPVQQPINSIAVLPLRNLSGDPAQDYFNDGLTESLITSLSGIEGLKVISRNSVFKFKDQDVDPREVGQKLGVDALLEGSVRQSGERVRVESRLVSTRDGSILWASSSDDRAQGDILLIEDDVVRGVVSGLRVRLDASSRQQLAKHSVENAEAYRAYLKGRHFWNQRTTESMRKAIEQFEQAIKLDQNYAPAYVGLAETYAVMEVNSLAPPGTAAPKAREYAQKALALDDTQAGAYAALGLLASLSDWNFAEGERLLQRALALNPNDATARQWYALNLLAQGKFAQTESELERALELDPLSLSIANSLSETYYYWRRYDRCLEQVEKIRELYPEETPFYLGRCHWQQGRQMEALPELQKSGAPSDVMAMYRAMAAGKLEEARRMVAREASGQPKTNSPYFIAEQYAMLGDKEAAFAWLEKAYAAHQADLVSTKIEPLFDSLRSDPRFADLLRRVGLPD